MSQTALHISLGAIQALEDDGRRLTDITSALSNIGQPEPIILFDGPPSSTFAQPVTPIPMEVALGRALARLMSDCSDEEAAAILVPETGHEYKF